MDATRPRRNPLLPALVGGLVLGYFDVRFYFIERQYTRIGLAIIVPLAAFIILFLMRSRFAWLAAVVVVVMIAVTLLLTYQLGYMGFPLTWFIGIVDLMLFAFFFTFLWKAKDPYLRYVASESR